MITEAFNRRTIANMEVALDRACLLLPTGGEKHRARRIIAGKIIECANRGETSLSGLTEAAYSAAMQLGSSAQSVRKKEAAD
jgi:hypothetical protein